VIDGTAGARLARLDIRVTEYKEVDTD